MQIPPTPPLPDRNDPARSAPGPAERRNDFAQTLRSWRSSGSSAASGPSLSHEPRRRHGDASTGISATGNRESRKRSTADAIDVGPAGQATTPESVAATNVADRPSNDRGEGESDAPSGAATESRSPESASDGRSAPSETVADEATTSDDEAAVPATQGEGAADRSAAAATANALRPVDGGGAGGVAAGAAAPTAIEAGQARAEGTAATGSPTAPPAASPTARTSEHTEPDAASAASVAAAPSADPELLRGSAPAATPASEASVDRSRGSVGPTSAAGREQLPAASSPNATTAAPSVATTGTTTIAATAVGGDPERANRERLRAPGAGVERTTTAAEARAAQINAAVEGGDAPAAPAAAIAPPSSAGSDGSGSTSMALAQGSRSAAFAAADPAPTAAPVLRGLSTLLAQRGGTLTLRLDPPDLGQVRIAVTIQGTTVSASLLASGNEARALLEGSLGQLRAALEVHGLTVERLAVDRLTPDRLAMERLGSDARGDRTSAAAPAAPHRSETGGHGSASGSGHDGARNDGQRQDAAEGQSRGRRDAEQERNGRHPATRRAFTETFAAIDGGRERTTR